MGFHYRWFDRDQEKMDEMGIPLTRAQIDERERAQEPQRLFSRGEQTGIVLTALIFAYGWTQDDTALVFFCLSSSSSCAKSQHIFPPPTAGVSRTPCRALVSPCFSAHSPCYL